MTSNIINLYDKEKDTGEISELALLYLSFEKIGYIHSIFKNSLNIKFGENLVHISDKVYLTSFGCCISKIKIAELIMKCKIEDIVVFKNNSLMFYTLSGIIKIHIKDFKKIDLKLRKNEDIKQNLKKIYKNLKKMDFENNIGIDKTEVLKYLKNGINKESQLYLTGRGKGLTPSGDDILLGYCIIENIYGKNIKLIYGNKTTVISNEYFKAFNRGYISKPFYNLFLNFSEDIQNIIEDIVKIGHTSGFDTLFGIFLGIKNIYNMEEII